MYTIISLVMGESVKDFPSGYGNPQQAKGCSRQPAEEISGGERCLWCELMAEVLDYMFWSVAEKARRRRGKREGETGRATESYI
jgi:hypothetical protein